MRDQLDGDLARALGESLDLGAKRFVGEVGRDGEEVRIHASS